VDEWEAVWQPEHGGGHHRLVGLRHGAPVPELQSNRITEVA
jgi:hypothetical protein